MAGHAGDDPNAGLKMVKKEGRDGAKKFRVEDPRKVEERKERIRAEEKELGEGVVRVSKRFRERFSPMRRVKYEPVANYDQGRIFGQHVSLDSKEPLVLTNHSTSSPLVHDPPTPDYFPSPPAEAYNDEPERAKFPNSRASLPVFPPRQSLVSQSELYRLRPTQPPYVSSHPHRHFRNWLDYDSPSHRPSVYDPPHLAGPNHPRQPQPRSLYSDPPTQMVYESAPALHSSHAPSVDPNSERYEQLERHVKQLEAELRSFKTQVSDRAPTIIDGGSSVDALYAHNPRQPFHPAPSQLSPLAPLNVSPPRRVTHPGPGRQPLLPHQIGVLRDNLQPPPSAAGYVGARATWDDGVGEQDSPAPFSDPPSISPDGQHELELAAPPQAAAVTWTNPTRPPLAQVGSGRLTESEI